MRHRTFACLLSVAAVAASASAFGKTIRMPANAPQVSFEIPDDWTVTTTPLGLDVAPPDKSALIVAGLIKRNRAALATWQKAAAERMRQFGVAFDPKATKPAAAPAAPQPSVFAGAPSIGTPEQGFSGTTGYEDRSAAGLSLEDLTGRAPPKGAKIPVNGLVIYGASYEGMPVDAELLNFELSPRELFLMQQESGKTDNRIGAIIDTVRRMEK